MWLVIRVVSWKEHLNCVWPNQELFAAQLFSAGAWVQEEAPAYWAQVEAATAVRSRTAGQGGLSLASSDLHPEVTQLAAAAGY